MARHKFTLATQHFFNFFFVEERVKNDGAKKKFAETIILEVIDIQSLRFYVYIYVCAMRARLF